MAGEESQGSAATEAFTEEAASNAHAAAAIEPVVAAVFNVHAVESCACCDEPFALLQHPRYASSMDRLATPLSLLSPIAR